MMDIPASLVDRLRSRQAALVAGLGCSEVAGAPGWDDLALRLIEWIDDPARKGELKELVAAGRRAAAVAYVGTRLPRDAVVEVLKDAYPTRADAPPAIAALGRIPWRTLITTGYDGLWAAAGAEAVLELAGSSAAPETLSLPGVQMRARLAQSDSGAALRELAARRSLVLIGFRPGDPDLATVAQHLAGAGGDAPHFLLVAGEAGLEMELLEAELGLTVVPYGGSLAQALVALAEAWRGVAAEARPADEDFEAWLEIWSRDPADLEPPAALARAEAALREEGRWDRLVELLLGRVELTTEPTEQVPMLREVARLYDQELGAPESALTALTAALRLEPQAEGLLAEAERAAGKAGRWAELAAEYAALGAELGDGPTLPRLQLSLARIYAEELNQTDDAIAAYRAVLAADPHNAAAARALADLLSRQERWAELAPALAQAAELESDPARAQELRLQLGELAATRLDDVDGAIKAYERVLSGGGTPAASPSGAVSGEALDALERLYRKRERWGDLARVLDMQAARAGDPAAAARLRRERADLLAERLGDTQASIRELEAALAHDPTNRAALRGLEKLYEKEGREADHLRTLERLVDLAESDAERLLLLRRLAAEWQTRVDRPEGLDRAADVLEQILQLDAGDAGAFSALAGVYRQAKRWLALAEALTRQIDATEGPAPKRALLTALGALYDEELHEPQRAAQAFAAAEALGDRRESTLAALARLDEQAGRWPAAVAALDKLAEVAEQPAARTEALVRAAGLAGVRLGDRSGAEARYVRALEIDPGHAGALTALGALYRGQGEPLRAAKLMREAEARTTNRIEKVRLLYELGALYQDELDDAAQATELFGRALDIDPEYVLAAERLVALHTRAERWRALEPLLEMLARKIEKIDKGAAADGGAAADLHARLGEVARRLGNLDKAARAYEAAHKLAPSSLPVLRGLGALRMERGEWQAAAALYRAIIDGHKAGLPNGELVEVYAALGRCDAMLGERDAAIGWYEKAFALDGTHRASVEAMAALHAEKGDFGALVLDKRTLLALASDDEARARISEEIGDLYLEKLANPAQAIAAYQAVLALAPGRRQTLHRLLELYTAARRWREAADTLVRLAQAEEASAVRAKYLYTAAVIHRDELGDADGAVALFNRALDQAPDLTKAFDAVERLLSEAGAWKELARNYRKMIKRLPAEGLSDLRLGLWSGLGEVSLRHLGDLEMATTALEVAVSLDPDSVQRHEQLADVYLRLGADHHDKAIAEQQWLIARNPERVPAYRALARLYGDIGAHDKRWCVAAALAFLRKADGELLQFYEEHRPHEVRTARRAFNDDVWQRVVHPDEDRFIAAIFMLLGQFVAATAAQQHQALGLRRKERVDVAADSRIPARVLRYVADTLELPAPDLFFKESEPQSVAVYNLQDKGQLAPTFVVGKGIEQRGSETELVYEMGKRMAFLRPERFVRYAVASPAALDVALRAALALGGSPVGSGPHNGEVERLTAELRRVVPRPVADQLALVARKLVSARGEVIDVQAWIAGADLTASRVGFALTNDLPAAARVIATEPAGASPLAAKERLKDLLAYSVSDDYFAVRKFLGLELM